MADPAPGASSEVGQRAGLTPARGARELDRPGQLLGRRLAAALPSCSHAATGRQSHGAEPFAGTQPLHFFTTRPPWPHRRRVAIVCTVADAIASRIQGEDV